MQSLEEMEDTAYGYELSRAEDWENREDRRCATCAWLGGGDHGRCMLGGPLVAVGPDWSCRRWEPDDE